MPFQDNASQQVIRIPFRRIEQHYGKDNDDDAGDDMVCCLRLASDTESKYHFTLSIDHPNPWYHTLDFTVERISFATYQRLIELLAKHGLTED